MKYEGRIRCKAFLRCGELSIGGAALEVTELLLEIDVASWIRSGVDDAAEEHGEEGKVEVLHPDHAVLAGLRPDGLCEFEVDLGVRELMWLVKVHLAGVIVEEGPEDRVWEAIVMLVGEVVCEVDGLAGVLVHQPLVHKWAVLGQDETARPADPDEWEWPLAAAEGGDETARGYFEAVLARCILWDGDGEAVGDDDVLKLNV
jgi:hypothetical protein